MRFSICLAFVIIGLAYGVVVPDQTAIERVLNTTRCLYSTESKLLSCTGLGGEVECDAFLELSVLGSRTFNFYGIGQLPIDYDFTKLESVRYFIYPRELDNTTYLGHSWTTTGQEVDLVLYYGETGLQSGVRISGLTCWTRLVTLLRGTLTTESVRVTGLETQVPLIGEVLVSDRNLQKKWLYGLGYGLGYGYGSPFGYYGWYNPYSFWG